MAYTPVPTVVTGQTWTASNHNTFIKDNFAAGVPDLFTTAGDMIYGTAADTAARLAATARGALLALNSSVLPSWLAKGALGTILRAGASDPAWSDLLTTLGFQYQFVAANVTTTSNGTFVALTGGPSVTITVGPNGLILVIGKFQVRNNSVGNSVCVTVHDGTSEKSAICYAAHHAAHANDSESIPLIGVLTGYTPGDSITLEARYMTDSGGTAEAKERFLSAISF